MGFILYSILALACIWIIAVYKVFILDDDDFQPVQNVVQGIHRKNTEAVSKPVSVILGKKQTKFSKSKHQDKDKDKDESELSETLTLHSDMNQNQKQLETTYMATTRKNKHILKEPYNLKWPPMENDGVTIPSSDGNETMPIIGLQVPRFWQAPKDVDLNKIGTTVNGHETIFLMIASYRDFQCRETITKAYERADYPERLYIGAVDQISPGDVGCVDIDVPCSQDNTQPICKYRDQISIFKVDAMYSTGPVTARHIGDRMYRGQYFVMQMDAHCHFINHWDSKLIAQWQSTGNEMAVLSSYLTDIQGSLTPDFESTRNTRPIMCNSNFEGMMPARYLRHGSQPELEAKVRDMPQMQPYWAAGFSFSRGHFKVRVPYDAYQPMVFQGEEIAIGVRGFTFGYDFYAPRDSVVFHEYADNSKRRKKIHMFWENTGHAGEGGKSLRRATSVIGMAPDIDASTWDHSELDRYGLGNERDVSLFYKLFLIDPQKRLAASLCPFVTSGVMHRDFQPFLRPDGNGIDYSFLSDYPTKDVLDKNLGKKHPYWERQILLAEELKDQKALKAAIDVAEKLGLDRLSPKLIERTKALLV